MGKFLMPSLGSDMEAGILLEWEKHPGDVLKRGDVIAVVETDKGAIEIEVYEDGVLDSVLVELGKKVPVGTPLAIIRGSDEELTHETKAFEAAAQNYGPNPRLDAKHATSYKDGSKPGITDLPAEHSATYAAPQTDKRVRITPAARKLAFELEINASLLVAHGPHNAIELSDVLEFQEKRAPVINSPSVQPATSTSVAVNPDRRSRATIGLSQKDGMRTAIAAAMSRSKREIPHYYLSHVVDLKTCSQFVSDRNAQREPTERILLSALFVKAVASAAAKYPEFNGHYENNQFAPSESVHIGMAINIRGGGLVAPAIHDADELELDGVMSTLRDLVARVRKGRYRASELNDPTLTVSSLGERGVQQLYGVIYPPQVAIVGFGTPADSVLVSDGQVVVAPSVVMTLAADHRVSDGHRGSMFLNAITEYLQAPEQL